MANDLGDVVALAVTIRDSDGDPADATAVACTITLPDGTTYAAPVAKVDTGVYTISYTPTLPGPHGVRWIATGTNASAFHDGFTARDTTRVPLLGLSDVKEWLNKDLTVHVSDEELRTTIDAATSLAEDYCGRALRPRTWTGTITATQLGVLVLPQPAALSVTSVADDSGAAVTGWELDGTGQIIAADPFSAPFLYGRKYTVTALLGVTGSTLDTAQQGVRELIRHMWSPQRGAAPLPMGGGDLPRPSTAHALPWVVSEKLDQIRLDF